jgi:hypothetical protein
MSLFDDAQFSEHYKQFLKYGWPHLSGMLDTVAPHAGQMDHLTRTVLFNVAGKYLHLTAKLALVPDKTIAEAHAEALAEVMSDGAVDNLIQTQLKQMLDQSVQRFQEDNQ